MISLMWSLKRKNELEMIIQSIKNGNTILRITISALIVKNALIVKKALQLFVHNNSLNYSKIYICIEELSSFL